MLVGSWLSWTIGVVVGGKIFIMSGTTDLSFVLVRTIAIGDLVPLAGEAGVDADFNLR